VFFQEQTERFPLDGTTPPPIYERYMTEKEKAAVGLPDEAGQAFPSPFAHLPGRSPGE
jgi:hypothetical protein